MSGDWMPDGVSDDTGAGQVLGGRYRLISQVGAGGTAVVWRAFDSVLAREVAVKVLAAHYADDPQSRTRVLHEARAAAALSHPNIAQVYDYGEVDVDGTVIAYVVMELIRGGSLHQRLRDGPVLPGYAMRMCAEVAAALAAAHAEGLAHRDIKPGNVMLASTGAKVVDFGIAAAIRPPELGMGEFEVFGTPAYLAPERLLHDAVEPASDVYALGVMLYRLLAGHYPWTSETSTQMLTAHVYLDPAPLLPMFQVPEHVTALCNRCLSKDPAQRPSAREMAALLAHGAGLQIVTDEPATTAARGPIAQEPSVLIRPLTTGDLADPHLPAPAQPVAAPQPAGRSIIARAAAPPSGPDDAAVGRQLPTLPHDGVLPDPSARAGARRNPVVYALAAVLVLAGAGVAVWSLRPSDQQAAASAPAPATTGSLASPGPAASGATTEPPPGASGAPGSAAPGGVDPTRTAQIGTATNPPVPGATTAPGVTASAPTTTISSPEPAVTTTASAAPPVERTLSSAAGSVRATCPGADTAQILSWTAIKPYKVGEGDREPGSAPAVSFKHGNKRITMTVTCDDWTPSSTST